LKIKRIGSELSIWFKQVFHLKNCWILLPGLCAVLLVYIVHYSNLSPELTARTLNESIAPWLVLIVFLILLSKSFISRDSLMIYLTVLAAVFLVRELNDTVFTVFGGEHLFKSKKLVDCLLICMVLWAFGWHERLFSCLNRSVQLKILLAGVLWTYFLSQLIARRVFRDVLPNERLLHIPLEETAETAAHIFFLGFALFCFFLYNARKKNQIQAFVPSSELGETPRQYRDIVE
jgi:hypothetical protein